MREAIRKFIKGLIKKVLICIDFYPNPDKRRRIMGFSTVFALTVFNQAHKKINVLYHNYARSVGLSDAAFWLFYSLYDYGYPSTQRDLCKTWFYTPQTINTALKTLEKRGLITRAVTENYKAKRKSMIYDGISFFIPV